MNIDGRIHWNRWRRSALGPDVFERKIDGEGSLYHTQYTQDAQSIIDLNTKIRNETNGFSADRRARKVGSIPVTVVYEKIRKWTQEGRLDQKDPAYGHRLNKLLKDLLRDPDYSKFRSTENV
ncbi:MAG: hypothetical protein ACPGSI_17440 [Pikeienuella sp.]